MSPLQKTPGPSADLGSRYNETPKQCNEQKARLELLEMLAKSEEDVRSGRVAPMQDSFDDIRKRLTEMQNV